MAQRNQHNINNDIKRLFTSSSLGKRVLQDMMLNNYVFNTTFDPRMDALELAHREGRRQLVLGILEICRGSFGEKEFNDDHDDAKRSYDPTE